VPWEKQNHDEGINVIITNKDEEQNHDEGINVIITNKDEEQNHDEGINVIMHYIKLNNHRD
jgi:hypothetical protein